MTNRPSKFERALEHVFEDRVRDFSNDLRELLEKLWLEGVQQGRHLERLETHDLERALKARAQERPATFESPSRGAQEPWEITLEQITRAARELEQLPGRWPDVRHLKVLAGENAAVQLEKLELRMRLEAQNPFEQPPITSTWSGASVSSSCRREIYGSWSEGDE